MIYPHALSTAPRTHSIRDVAIVAVLLLLPSNLVAGAWTQEARHGQIIITSSFFQTTQTFDKVGNTENFPDRGRFRQFVVESYLEYGLTSRSTLVLKVPAPFLGYSSSFGAQHSAGLGDVEIAGRRRFNSLESPWAVAGQLTVTVPAYSANRNPAPGNHQQDVEGRFLLGRGSQWGHHHVFWNAEAAFRYRSGAPADQVRADLTAGVDLTRRLMVMGQSFSILGLQNGSPLRELTNPNAQSDFDLHKGQVSVVLSLGHGMRLQAGWNEDIAGRDTGRGQTAILAFWKIF